MKPIEIRIEITSDEDVDKLKELACHMLQQRIAVAVSLFSGHVTIGISDMSTYQQVVDQLDKMKLTFTTDESVVPRNDVVPLFYTYPMIKG